MSIISELKNHTLSTSKQPNGTTCAAGAYLKTSSNWQDIEDSTTGKGMDRHKRNMEE